MKALVTAVSLVLAASSLRAATAYDALNVVGKERSKAVLDQVIEVRGAKGAPTPKTWKVIVNDSEAIGSIREFSVQGPKISGERTPADGSSGQVMNMSQLNLDSDGAHTVAERAAKKSGFAYDHVEYALRAGTSGGAPIWELRLVDVRKGGVATLTVAADSGKLLTSEGLEIVGQGTEEPDERVAENRPPRERSDREREQDKRRKEEASRRAEAPREDKPGNKLTRFADRAGRHIGGFFDRIGNKISGNSSDTPRRATPPPPAPKTRYRDSNGTEYYRPRD